MTERKLKPLHPGEVLLEDFLKPMNLTEYRLAKEIGVHPGRINKIVHETQAITSDTALRFARFFGVSAQFWMNLQVQFDLEVAKVRLQTKLQKIHEYEPA